MDDSVVQTAMNLLDQGEGRKAFDLLCHHVLRCPEDLEGLLCLGVIHGRTGSLQRAIQLFSRVLEKKPDHGYALFHLGLAQMALNDPSSAEPFLRLALQHVPDSSEGWGLLAQALEGQGRDEAARGLLREAVQMFPEDSSLRCQLLRSIVRAEASEQGRSIADWLEAHATEDYVCLRTLLLFSLSYLDPERTRRIAARLWNRQFGELLQDQELLRAFSYVYPAQKEHLIQGALELLTCPSCGTAVTEGELLGLVIPADPIERLAAMAAFKLGRRCSCGMEFPRNKARLLLFPECSIACIVSPGPHAISALAGTGQVPEGGLGEPAEVRPPGGEWLLCEIPETNGAAFHRALRDLIRNPEDPRSSEVERIWRQQEENFLPLDGADVAAWFISASLLQEQEQAEVSSVQDLEEKARYILSELQVAVGQCRMAEGREPIPETGRLPAWMLAERKQLLVSGRRCSPWPLSHRCRCGADLRQYVFGTDPDRLYDLAAVDEAALAGRKYMDPETGEDWSGFVCDACGRIHAWSLGIQPAEESWCRTNRIAQLWDGIIRSRRK